MSYILLSVGWYFLLAELTIKIQEKNVTFGIIFLVY